MASPLIADPLLELPAAGRRLVAVAKRILRSKGWQALTVGAVAGAAGLDKSAIRYYFGNKDGLVAVLVESVIHDENAGELARLEQLQNTDDRLTVHLRQHQMSAESLDAITFFELVPVMLRREPLRERLASWYEWYRKADAWALALDKTQADLALGLASLLEAVTDGLTIQSLADPSMNLDAAYFLWHRMICRALSRSHDATSGLAALPTDPGALVGGGDRRPPRAPLCKDMPVVPDPLLDLSPSGRRLVQEAKRTLVNSGWSGLSVGAITSAAQLEKPAVSYYFGNKAGLVVALVESIIHDENAEELSRLHDLGDGRNALDLHLEARRADVHSHDSVIAYFELVPNLLRDRALRTRLASWNRWYCEVDECIFALATGRQAAEFGDLALLTEAVTDGLSLQLAADPELDIERAHQLWEGTLRRELAHWSEPIRGCDQTPKSVISS